MSAQALQRLRRFADWLLYSSLFTAGCAALLGAAMEAWAAPQSLIPGSGPHRLVFGAVLAGYNVHSWFHARRARRRAGRTPGPWFNEFAVLAMLGGLIALHTFLQLAPVVMMRVCIVGAVTLLYTLSGLSMLPRRLAAFISSVKVLLLALVWTAATGAMPLAAHGLLEWRFAPELVVRFVLILALCLAFDVRDVEKDAANGVRSLSVWMGAGRVRRLGFLLIVLFALLGAFLPGVSSPAWVYGVTAVWAALAVQRALATYHPAWFLIGVDGAMALYGLLSLTAHFRSI